MPAIEQDWHPFALSLGYANEKEMLENMYYGDNLSIAEIASVLECSTYTVRRRLLMWGVKLKQRGGNQRGGQRALALLTDETLFQTDAKELALKYDVNQTTVYLERRIRKSIWNSVL